jgi:alkylhydroperoxidase family enzyme
MPAWRIGNQAGAYFGALLNTPPFALNRAQFSTLIRTAGERPGTYSHTDREMVDQVLAALSGTNYFLTMHIGDAVAAGVRLKAIVAIRAGRDQDLTEDELLLVTYIRQVATGSVRDQTYDAMEQRLGVRGLVEYTILITGLLMTMRQMQAFNVPQPSDTEVEAMIDQYRDEGVRPPDFNERVR